MVARDQERANGRTAGEEIVKDRLAEFETPAAAELPDERERKFKTPGFARMRLTMSRDDRAVIDRAHVMVDQIIEDVFSDAFAIMHELYDLVREPVLQPDGTPLTDDFGLPVWKRTRTGLYVEDWNKLTTRQREHFLYMITTRLFEWGQNKERLWAEAMFFKGKWRDSFSSGYESLENPKATINDREARAQLDSQEEYYFAIFTSYLSRKADSAVRSLELLSQRLKDVHVSNGVR